MSSQDPRPSIETSQRWVDDPEPRPAPGDDECDPEEDFNMVANESKTHAFRRTFSLALRPAQTVATPPPPPRAMSMNHFGDDEVPPTACWEEASDMPHYHMLMCGHLVQTPGIQPCGSNCQTSSTAESKPYGPRIVCDDRECERMTARMENMRKTRDSPIFMPRKKKPAPPVQRQILTRAAKKSEVPSIDDSDGAVTNLTNALKMPKPEASLMPREIENLRMEGTDALRFGLSHGQRAVDSPFFSTPDREFVPAKLDRKPTFKIAKAKKPSVPAGNDHRPNAGMWSVDEVAYDKQLAENPAAVGGDEVSAEQLPRDEVDVGDEDEDDDSTLKALGVQTDGTFHKQELHCICKQVADAAMQQCEECDRWFHPKCLGVNTVNRCLECAVRRTHFQALAQKRMGKQTSFFEQEKQARKARQIRRDNQKELREHETPQEQVRRRITAQRMTVAMNDDDIEMDEGSAGQSGAKSKRSRRHG